MRRLLILAALAACNRHEPPPPPECTQGMRTQPLRLLTRFEVDNTARDLLHDATRPGQGLPPEPLSLGLDNNGDIHTVTADFQARLLDVAEAAATRAVAEHKAELISCATEDAACGAQFVDTFGRRAFRRPLTSDERDTFTELFEQQRGLDGFDVALQATLTAFLMSPQFLYRLEPFIGQLGVETLDAYSLASRLSYFLWGSMPDEALLASAESGALLEERELAAQAQRLLADPRAAAVPEHFFELYLQLEGLDGVTKDPALYPAFTDAMRGSWKQSIGLYAREQKKLSSSLTSSVLFVDEHMGAMYGNGPVAPGSFLRLEMPAAQRSGFLTQPGFLARLSSPDQSSPVRRGVFVLQNLLCEPVSPPPPTVMAVPPKVSPDSTTRERFDVHANTMGCSACHVRMDGIGFGFEHYDALGAWRTTENNKPIDATGTVVAVQEQSLEGPFDGASELMSRLSTSRQVHDCMSAQWVRLALGRVETEGDKCTISRVQQTFFDAGGDFDALRVAIATSPSFRYHLRTTTP